MDSLITLVPLYVIYKILTNIWGFQCNNKEECMSKVNRILGLQGRKGVLYDEKGEVDQTNVGINPKQATIVETSMGTIDTFNSPMQKMGY